MRLRQIEVFHATMQVGSLSGAADLLNISQPAASKMLAQAEHSLGLSLFTRLPGGLKPTREATLLFRETKNLHSSLERVRKLASTLALQPGGLLRIGCIPSLGLRLVPNAVSEFLRICPDVAISIRTENNETLSALLLSQELDLGIAFEPTAKTGICIQELGRAKAVFVGSRLNEDCEPFVHLRDLDFSKWVAVDTVDPLGSKINTALAALVSSSRKPMLEVKTHYLARALVESGIGFTIVDEYTANAGTGTSRVIDLEPALSIGICAMTSRTIQGTHALKVLVQQLENCLQKPQLVGACLG
ncbi:LysR family transcriptional regulator [Bradyrhizobium sp. SSUT77]|uniref:LysR family transcriptional regulator n=1 Tax=Bradyrhizobium sp. SSUT77 TaxID=3040603 RepID=UPI00244C6638|nr:LysR family transcriptional regulator [Bradyrhizobium sp. SSUT77]MDH2348752.1 LysR family transcriptional regulator [Bradyrhizobium sp. SSUT77]